MLAVGIVHVAALDRSLMPWIIASQTIPILAIAPMVIVVLAAIGVTGLLPKALISTYLSFFPVTVGMVKGLRSPEPIQLDLMRTYNASPSQIFWKLRVPASVPFLFASMKVAIAISLVGAIVGELPTGAAAGIGARLLTGSYYGQTIADLGGAGRRLGRGGAAGRARRRRRAHRRSRAWGRGRHEPRSQTSPGRPVAGAASPRCCSSCRRRPMPAHGARRCIARRGADWRLIG